MSDLSEPHGRITLKDVAKAAGVHVSTASRALNPETEQLVGEAVVARVREVAHTLGYRPNSIASSLRTRRTRTIGVLLPDVVNTVFPPMVRAVEEALAAQGYLVLVAHAEYGDTRQRVFVEQMMARQVDGLILATSSRQGLVIEACLEQRIPMVTLTRADPDLEVSSVINDETASMYLVVQHLVKLGHTRIAHLAGPKHISTGFARRRTFAAAMEEAGLKPTLIAETAVFTREAGAKAAMDILDQAPETTAIVTANDLFAVGCLDVLRERGLKCPHDISITGHNDMPLIDMVDPPMTTIRVDFAEMGAAGARLLLQHLRSPNAPIAAMTLKPQLVVRSSTAPPRSS